MAQANDSVTVTPGSGATIATHLVNGKEYQVVMIAHNSGHIQDTLPTYYINRVAAAGAANQRTIDIFNASGSGVIVHLKKLFIFHNQSAITGVPHAFTVHRTTAAGTGGTSLAVVRADTSNAQMSVGVSARSNATGGATTSDLLFYIATNPEETLAAAAVHAGLNWMPEGPNIQEVVLREGEGIVVTQTTSSVVGIWHALAVVTTE